MERREKLYRDLIHKDIKWDAAATAIINTAEFQRLDGIKQLGFAELVYRGAKHSRFEHSIGAYWLAKQIMQLIPSNHERLGLTFPPLTEFNSCLGSGDQLITNLSKVVSYAGLLHDITHIPFGHTLEDEFQGIFKYKHDDLESPRLPYVLFDSSSGISKVFKQRRPWITGLENDELLHLLDVIITYKDEVGKPGYEKSRERTFEEILNDKIEYHEQLPPYAKERVPQDTILYWKDLLTWYLTFKENKLFHPFMTDIVANTICSDILDYIKRDVYSTGLGMDFDFRVLQYFVLGREIVQKGELWRLALCIRDKVKGIDRIDIASEVLNILGYRYSLAERVYYHKSKVSAGAMLAKALSLVPAPKEPNLRYGSTGGTYSGISRSSGDDHLLAVNMTDDGFLCWIVEQAQKAEDRPRQSSPIATADELANTKGADHVQIAMANKDGSSLVPTNSNGTSTSPASQAKELIDNIRKRRLYKPVVIITHDMARSERRVKYFTTKYETRESCMSIERELTSKLRLDEGRLVIYCPRPQPQVKQMESRVLVKGPTIQPLWDDDRFREQAAAITKGYERLWKLFIFLHPDNYESPIVRQKVTEEFHRFEHIHKFSARDLAPYQWLDDEQKIAWEEYTISLEKPQAQIWHPQLGELIKTAPLWEYIRNLKNGRAVSTNLTLASAALYLYDFEVDPGRVDAAQKPPWLGIQAIIEASPLKKRLFANQKWKEELEAELVSPNRDGLSMDDSNFIKNAYFNMFRRWIEEQS